MADILRFSSPWSDYGLTTNFLLSWTETISGNSSVLKNITVTTEQTPTGSGYKRTLVNGSATINGTSFSYAAGSVYNGLTVVSGKELTVPHDANGSKSITVSMTANVGGDIKNVSTTVNLTTIATASQLSVSSSYTISSASSSISITVTPYVSGRYHRAYVYYGNSSKTFNLGQINSTSATSKTLDNGSLLDLISNTLTADVTIQLATFQNSDYTGQLGDVKSAGSKINIDKTAIKPSISLAAISKNSGPLSGLIAGYSTAKTTTTITNARGASTAAVSYSFSGGASEQSSSASQVVTNVLPSSASNYTIYISATVVDSRGASATSTSVSASVIGYTRPYFTFNAYRCRSTSDSTADIAGSAVYYSRTAVSYTSGISGNSLTCRITGPSSTITAATAQSGFVSLATSASKTFTATAYDSITGSAGATTVTIVIPAAVYPLDLYQNGNSIGVGLGATAVAGQVYSSLMIQAPRFLSNVIRRDANTDTFRLIGQDTLEPWSVKRMTLSISTRHAGNGLLCISYGCDAVALAGNVYCQMWYYGNLDSHSYGKNFYAYWNSTNSTISFFWNHYDNDELRITCLANRNGFTPFQGAWVTDTTPYGELLATSNLGNANNANYADYAGNSTKADQATKAWLVDDWIWKQYGTTRPSTANRPAGENVNGAFYSFLSSSSMTESAPMANGVIYQRNWDNNNHYDTQFFVPIGTNGTPTNVPQFRSRSSTAWGSWISLVSENTINNYVKTLWTGDYAVTSTTQTTITDGALYEGIVVTTRTGTDASFRHSMFLSMGQIPTSKPSQYYGWSGTSQYGGIYIWKSGNNLIFQGGISGCTGNVYGIFGIGGKA